MPRRKKKHTSKGIVRASVCESIMDTCVGDSIKAEEEDEWSSSDIISNNKVKIKSIHDFRSDDSFENSSDILVMTNNYVESTAIDNSDAISTIKAEQEDDSLFSLVSDVDPLEDINCTDNASKTNNKNPGKLSLVKVLKDSRGNEIYSIDGFVFRFHAIGDNGTIHIRCRQSHHLKCLCSAVISKRLSAVTLIELTGEHNHVIQQDTRKTEKILQPDIISMHFVNSPLSSDDSESRPSFQIDVLKTSDQLDEYYVNGYVYQCNCIRPDNLIYALCRDARGKQCTGRAKLRKNNAGNVTLVKETGFHNHPPEYRKRKIKKPFKPDLPKRQLRKTKFIAPVQTTPISVFKTSRGNCAYIIEGYIYVSSLSTRLGVTYLECNEIKKNRCTATAVVDYVSGAVKLIEKNGRHNHKPDSSAAIRREALFIMLKRLKEEPEFTPLSVYKQVLKDWNDGICNLEDIDKFPSYKSVLYTLIRNRKNYRNILTRKRSQNSDLNYVSDVGQYSTNSERNVDEYSRNNDSDFENTNCDSDVPVCSTNNFIESKEHFKHKTSETMNDALPLHEKQYSINKFIHSKRNSTKWDVLSFKKSTMSAIDTLSENVIKNSSINYLKGPVRSAEEKSVVRILRKRNGRKEYCLNGYVYKMGMVKKDGDLHVQCRNYGTENCKAYVVIRVSKGKASVVKQSGTHSHKANIFVTKEINIVRRMLEIYQLKPESTLFSMYAEAMREIHAHSNNDSVNVKTIEKNTDSIKTNSNLESDEDPLEDDLEISNLSSSSNDFKYKHVVKVLQTNKEKDVYFIDGYIYFNTRTKLGKTYAACRKYKSGCDGRGIFVISQDAVTVLQLSKSHSHEPDILAAIKAEAIGFMLQKCKEQPESTPSQILNQVMNESYNTCDEESMKYFPSLKNALIKLRRFITKHRKSRNMSPLAVKRIKQTFIPSSNFYPVPNSNYTDLKTPVKVLRSLRRRDGYVIDGYIFHTSKMGELGKVYVHCRNYRTKGCVARAVVQIQDNGEVLLVQKRCGHNHIADILEIVRTEALGKMINKYKEHPELSAAKIYDMVIKESYDMTDPETARSIPPLKAVVTRLRRTGTKLRRGNSYCPPKRKPRYTPNSVYRNPALDSKLNVIEGKSSAIKHDIKILQTSKGRAEYCIDGYLYHFTKASETPGKIYVHCKSYQRSKCWGRGILKLDDGTVTVVQLSTSHSHEPDTIGAIKAEALGLMTQMLKEDPDSTPVSVYNRVMSESFDRTNINVSTAIPSYTSISKTLRNITMRIRGLPPNRRINQKRNKQTNSNLEKESIPIWNSLPNSIIEESSVQTVRTSDSADVSKSIVKILKTSKGKDEYFFDGYIYQLTRPKNDSSLYLQCKSYRRHGCCARGEIRLDSGAVTLVRKSGSHNHSPEISAAIRSEAIKMMIDRFKEHPESSPSSVYNQVMKESFDSSDPMVKAAIPSYKSVSSILQKKAASIRRNLPNCPSLDIKRKRIQHNISYSLKKCKHLEQNSNFEQSSHLGQNSNLGKNSNLEQNSSFEQNLNSGISEELDRFSIETNLNHDSLISGPRLDLIPPTDTLTEANSVLEPDSIQKYIIWKVSD